MHEASPRRNLPFVAVNCAAPSGVAARERAVRPRERVVHGGRRPAQGTIRAGQRGHDFPGRDRRDPAVDAGEVVARLAGAPVRASRGTQTIETDVRVVAATNHDLLRLAKEGKFREDLYYRLNVVKIDLPPLCERAEDIPAARPALRSRNSVGPQRAPKTISPEAMEVLIQFRWPGNIRELENAIERACVTSRDDVIRPENLPPDVLKPSRPRHQLPGGRLEAAHAAARRAHRGVRGALSAPRLETHACPHRPDGPAYRPVAANDHRESSRFTRSTRTNSRETDHRPSTSQSGDSAAAPSAEPRAGDGDVRGDLEHDRHRSPDDVGLHGLLRGQQPAHASALAPRGPGRALRGASVAELSAAMPRSGGDYVYLYEAYGPLAAFLSGWVSFLIGFGGPIAVACVGLGELSARSAGPRRRTGRASANEAGHGRDPGLRRSSHLRGAGTIGVSRRDDRAQAHDPGRHGGGRARGRLRASGRNLIDRPAAFHRARHHDDGVAGVHLVRLYGLERRFVPGGRGRATEHATAAGDPAWARALSSCSTWRSTRRMRWHCRPRRSGRSRFPAV